MSRDPAVSALLGVGSLAATGIVIVAACGGQVYGNPLGYLDDAGVFHSLDGAVIFGPGSACAGYDSAAFATLATRQPCSSDDDCVEWLKAFPPGYATKAQCLGDSNSRACLAFVVVATPTLNTGAGLYCTPGPEGDAYCAAVLGQFLLGDGRAETSCARLCTMHTPEIGTPYCEPGTDVYKCAPIPGAYCACGDAPLLTNIEFCVQRGDASHCEAPCVPPPPPSDGGTSGSDGSADQ